MSWITLQHGTTQCPKISFAPPEITPADLEAFHNAHFSTPSVDHFRTHFLGPAPEGENGEAEEYGGLGYYPDGVKRTLTDEQIAMFRHSEIQALLRERRHAEESKATSTRDEEQIAGPEEGELEDDQGDAAPEPELLQPASKIEFRNVAQGNTKLRKAERRKGKGHKQLPKPDLRKRTWDKVDRGLQSLEYGDEAEGESALPAAAQRRRITYEDV